MYGLYGLVQRLAEGRDCEYNALHERLKLSKPLCMVMREVANGWCVCGAVKFLSVETRQIILEVAAVVAVRCVVRAVLRCRSRP